MKKFTENKIIILVSLSIVAFPLSSFAQKEENETPAEVTSLEQLILKVQEELFMTLKKTVKELLNLLLKKTHNKQFLIKLLPT